MLRPQVVRSEKKYGGAQVFGLFLSLSLSLSLSLVYDQSGPFSKRISAWIKKINKMLTSRQPHRVTTERTTLS